MTDVLFPLLYGAEGTTGVIVTWFVESGDEVTPTTLIAQVAVDKVDVDVYPEDSGVITLLVEENREVRQGALIAQVS